MKTNLFLVLVHLSQFSCLKTKKILKKKKWLLQARAGIREVHFFPFNPVDKRTALTYIDSNGNWHRASKGAPEQVF